MGTCEERMTTAREVVTATIQLVLLIAGYAGAVLALYVLLHGAD